MCPGEILPDGGEVGAVVVHLQGGARVVAGRPLADGRVFSDEAPAPSLVSSSASGGVPLLLRQPASLLGVGGHQLAEPGLFALSGVVEGAVYVVHVEPLQGRGADVVGAFIRIAEVRRAKGDVVGCAAVVGVGAPGHGADGSASPVVARADVGGQPPPVRPPRVEKHLGGTGASVFSGGVGSTGRRGGGPSPAGHPAEPARRRSLEPAGSRLGKEVAVVSSLSAAGRRLGLRCGLEGHLGGAGAAVLVGVVVRRRRRGGRGRCRHRGC